MENNAKLQTGIFGFITLALLVLSVITMAVCFSLQADIKGLADAGGPDDAVLANGTPMDGTDAGGDAENRKPIYVMTIENGAVVVIGEDGSVVRTVNAYAAFLPQSDYDALVTGIRIYTEAELTALIEDFSS